LYSGLPICDALSLFNINKSKLGIDNLSNIGLNWIPTVEKEHELNGRLDAEWYRVNGLLDEVMKVLCRDKGVYIYRRST
jgi:hypothetical protein